MFKVVIPARYASSRLPGKPLLKIAGKPMIQHVVQQAQASGADEVIVATDDSRIADVVRGFGGQVCMTGVQHESGTDRLAEVCELQGWSSDAVVVNVQGDEPLMPVAAIRQAADMLLGDSSADISTLCAKIDSATEVQDPNIVKVVRNVSNRALYFSRAPIPFERDVENSNWSLEPVRRHIGLYGYRVGVLKRFSALGPCELELREKLEQLRAMWHGMAIQCDDAVELPGPGVDTPQDLQKVELLMQLNAAQVSNT